MLGSPWVNKGVVKHACGEVFVGFGFVIFDARVFSCLGSCFGLR